MTDIAQDLEGIATWLDGWASLAVDDPVSTIREAAATARRAVIVGGGYIGLEIGSVYAALGVARHLASHGRLPDRIGGPWAVIPMRHIIEERGTNPEVTPEEQGILDAMLRENRAPGGVVRLIPHRAEEEGD